MCMLLCELGQVIWYATFSSSVKQGGPIFIVTVYDSTITIILCSKIWIIFSNGGELPFILI